MSKPNRLSNREILMNSKSVSFENGLTVIANDLQISRDSGESQKTAFNRFVVRNRFVIIFQIIDKSFDSNILLLSKSRSIIQICIQYIGWQSIAAFVCHLNRVNRLWIEWVCLTCVPWVVMINGFNEQLKPALLQCYLIIPLRHI